MLLPGQLGPYLSGQQDFLQTDLTKNDKRFLAGVQTMLSSWQQVCCCRAFFCSLWAVQLSLLAAYTNSTGCLCSLCMPDMVTKPAHAAFTHLVHQQENEIWYLPHTTVSRTIRQGHWLIVCRSPCCAHSAAAQPSRRQSTTMCGCRWTLPAALPQPPAWPMAQAARTPISHAIELMSHDWSLPHFSSCQTAGRSRRCLWLAACP